MGEDLESAWDDNYKNHALAASTSTTQSVVVSDPLISPSKLLQGMGNEIVPLLDVLFLLLLLNHSSFGSRVKGNSLLKV